MNDVRATTSRPRTRVTDAAEGKRAPQLGRVVRVVVVGAWAVVLAAVGRQRVYVSHDSISNYAHVWYIAEHLRHGWMLPFHMPMLAGGHAYAYPYAFVPWTLTAVARLVLGDWAVTLCLIAGFVAAVVLVFVAFPELRTPWCEVVVLVNPALIMALLVGQIPFLWAVASLFAAIAAWRRRRPWLATGLGAVAMATHPAVLLPLTLAVVVGALPRAAGRLELVWRASLATAAALPAVGIVLRSPAVTETTLWFRVEQLIRIDAARGTVVLLPFVLLLLRRFHRRITIPAAFGLLCGLNALMLGPMNRYAWAAPWREPDERIGAYLDSPDFRPGATYRVLGFADGRMSMYRLIERGARLDGEFFPESQARRSWPSAPRYERFLRDRRIDTVIAWHSYDTRWHTNEHDLLRRLSGDSGCSTDTVVVDVVAAYPAFDVYRIRDC